MPKCVRCCNELILEENGWARCPKCKNQVFIGDPTVKEELPDTKIKSAAGKKSTSGKKKNESGDYI